MDAYIAVDIGGTFLRVASYRTGKITQLTYERIYSDVEQPGIYNRLVKVIEQAWPKGHTVIAIGIAAPGPLDPFKGIILATPNIPEWHDFPLSEKLTSRFKVPIYLENDANLAAFAEWKFGAGRGHHNLLYLTISTGIGGGVIIDDRILHGHHGLAAELGHVTVLADGPVCSCGQKGHLEALAAGPAIVRYILEQLEAGKKSRLRGAENPDAQEVAAAAKRGDALAKSAFSRAGKYLGIAVAGFLHTFDPSIVIIGGGVSQSGTTLFESFEASLRAHVFNPRYLEEITITTGSLGDDAGLLGAFALAQMEGSDQ